MCVSPPKGGLCTALEKKIEKGRERRREKNMEKKERILKQSIDPQKIAPSFVRNITPRSVSFIFLFSLTHTTPTIRFILLND